MPDTRCQREIGRRGTKPSARILLGHGDLHQVTDLSTREHQVVLDVILGQTHLGEQLVANILGRMTAHAVVHELLGPTLDGRMIVEVDIRLLECVHRRHRTPFR